MAGQTLRRRILALLEEQAMDARELSAALGIREKEVTDHLVHVERTVAAGKRRFVLSPSRCLDCGFEFKKRRRLTRPSRCPHCKGQRVIPPRFRVI